MNKTKKSYFGVDGKPMAAHCKIRIDTSEFGNTLNTAVFDAIETIKPDIVIHTAAYTNVDSAEIESDSETNIEN